MKLSDFRPFLSLPLAAALTAPLFGAEKVTFEDHIYPIFSNACLNCHNPDKKKGDLDLSTYLGTMAGGSGGKIVTSGDGASSKLYGCVIQTESPKMPPEGEKLSKKDTDLIRAWIDGGLLETKDSKAKKKEKPAFDLVADTGAGKPEGPPPMPEDLTLEPVVVGQRSYVVADMEASPWAPLLAVTGQKQVLLYNTDTLQLAGVLPFPNGMPETLSFHPGGQYLLAGGGIGGKSGTTIVWDVKTGKSILSAGKEFDSILAADLRADLGGVAFGGPSRLVKLWDTQADEQLLSIKKHTDWVTALAYSPDGVLLATGDRNNGVQVWEAHTGNEFYSLRDHQQAITDIAWRSDSNLLATASEDGNFIIWEMKNGNAVKKQRAHDSILALDYARDGHLITSGRDKKVKLWKPDFNALKELPTFPEIVTEVAFSHDGKRFFTADYHGHISVWDRENFQKIGELSANPPHIADRLAALRKEQNELPAKVAEAHQKLVAVTSENKKAQDAAQAAQKAFQDAKNLVAGSQNTVKDRNNKLGQNQKKNEQLRPKIEQEKQQLAAARKAAEPLSQKIAELAKQEQALAAEV
ncbi:MAG: c-type cytochrome domain-containing protein, partial [Verrucomicrobiales bacterium]